MFCHRYHTMKNTFFFFFPHSFVCTQTKKLVFSFGPSYLIFHYSNQWMSFTHLYSSFPTPPTPDSPPLPLTVKRTYKEKHTQMKTLVQLQVYDFVCMCVCVFTPPFRILPYVCLVGLSKFTYYISGTSRPYNHPPDWVRFVDVLY